QINGKTHDGSASAPVPTLFGMNFQAVSVGQKLHEKSVNVTGGYLDSAGTPSPSLLSEIQFVDGAIGAMAQAIEDAGLADSTVIIVTAKHGQSPIDPNRVTRIPADVPTGKAPSDLLGGIGTGLPGGGLVGQALEDDVSLIWLTDPTKVASSVATLEKNEAMFGGGEIFSGRALEGFVANPAFDSRVPDIIVAPNVGVTYTGGTKKIAEHGGSSSDDRNVMMLVSNNRIAPAVINGLVETRQIAPTILKILGLDPNALQAARKENTAPLPSLPY
ncbi:MAG TPA: alkaline phosphatase family protein, partial [Candidatus Sulfopaludibacter sp.]|nr:alkaline phosphatase family protein [Candidatus Sulfopaludibacter sp.]